MLKRVAFDQLQTGVTVKGGRGGMSPRDIVIALRSSHVSGILDFAYKYPKVTYLLVECSE